MGCIVYIARMNNIVCFVCAVFQQKKLKKALQTQHCGFASHRWASRPHFALRLILSTPSSQATYTHVRGVGDMTTVCSCSQEVAVWGKHSQK